MIKIDPIIAVRDVEASVEWYVQVFGFRRIRGEMGRFAVLASDAGEIILCLHEWETHGHPTMMNPGIAAGNGLILYFKTDKLEATRQNLKESDYKIEEDIHINENSTKREFSLQDPDGYFLIITEYHEYDG